GRPRRPAHRTHQNPGRLPRRPGRRTLQSRPLPLLMTAAGAPGPADVADESLAEAGRARIDWAQRGMPVLRLITERYAAERPFGGLTVTACLHVTAETAVLIGALRDGGAAGVLAAPHRLSAHG